MVSAVGSGGIRACMRGARCVVQMLTCLFAFHPDVCTCAVTVAGVKTFDDGGRPIICLSLARVVRRLEGVL